MFDGVCGLVSCLRLFAYLLFVLIILIVLLGHVCMVLDLLCLTFCCVCICDIVCCWFCCWLYVDCCFRFTLLLVVVFVNAVGLPWVLWFCAACWLGEFDGLGGVCLWW